MAVVGLFALCHGHAHGLEMPTTAAGLSYGAGFVLATALLHATGIGAGLMIQHYAQAVWLRATGVAVCAASVLLVLH
jgi:urease accessory protein